MINGKPLKVVFIAGTLGRGGAEKQLFFMLRALKDMGVDVLLLSLTEGEVYESKIRAAGIEIIAVKSRSRIGRIIEISRFVLKWRPDIVQSAHFYTNIYTAFAARLARSYSIGAIRNDLISEVSLDRWFGRRQALWPQFLIANSRLAIENSALFGISENKIGFLGNVVEVPGNHTRSSESRGVVEVLFVARLVGQKRPGLFVEMANELINSVSYRLHFTIVGDGPLRADVERQIKELGLENDVISLAGECGDVDRFYRQADVFVMTSMFEGTPNAALEAMSHGLPVVVPHVGGIPAVVSDDRGIVFSPNDFKGLVSAVQKLVGDRELCRKLGQAGRDYVLANHSADTLGNRLIAVYTELLKNK